MKATLRWILFLPVAVVAEGLVEIPIDSCLSIMPSFMNHPIDLITSLAGGIAFVTAGAYTAPKHRLVIAVSLTVFHAVISIIIVGTMIKALYSSSPAWWIACGVIGTVGTISGCLFILIRGRKPANTVSG